MVRRAVLAPGPLFSSSMSHLGMGLSGMEATVDVLRIDRGAESVADVTGSVGAISCTRGVDEAACEGFQYAGTRTLRGVSGPLDLRLGVVISRNIDESLFDGHREVILIKYIMFTSAKHKTTFLLDTFKGDF